MQVLINVNNSSASLRVQSFKVNSNKEQTTIDLIVITFYFPVIFFISVFKSRMKISTSLMSFLTFILARFLCKQHREFLSG